jgi:glycosyltransferase involved in cell wall biosynthesis
LRIGINGRFLIAKRTGVQRAAYNLLVHLLKIDQENEYIIFTGPFADSEGAFQKPNVQLVYSNLKGSESIQNHYWEQVSLPRLAKRHRVDILHSPANMAPILFSGRSVVNIHDLCFVVNPDWYSFLFRSLYTFSIPLIAKRARCVITNSNNSKNDLLKFCKLPSSKVKLIYWAIDEKFRAPHVDDTLEKKEDYVLYVGSLEPRKNISGLIQAFESMKEQHPELKTKLYLVGGESPLFGDVRFKVKKFKDDVILKGFVTDQELIQIYRRAKLLVYPSLYEGFGLPPLEAMASGTPVITSKNSSIPEVVGKAAKLIDPNNSHEIYQAMYDVLSNNVLQMEMIMQGLEQSQHFTWDKVARATLAVYHEVLNERYLDYATWRRIWHIEEQGVG